MMTEDDSQGRGWLGIGDNPGKNRPPSYKHCQCMLTELGGKAPHRPITGAVNEGNGRTRSKKNIQISRVAVLIDAINQAWVCRCCSCAASVVAYERQDRLL